MTVLHLLQRLDQATGKEQGLAVFAYCGFETKDLSDKSQFVKNTAEATCQECVRRKADARTVAERWRGPLDEDPA